MEILNITNGSNTIDLMKQADIQGDCISWDDLLHEGPVLEGLSLDELSIVRADYLVKQGYADESHVREKFEHRNSTLKSYYQYKKVILWFEHDLYDQLQLIQILDWFNQLASIETDLRLICVNKYLGRHSLQDFAKLPTLEERVSVKQLQLATRAWQAFTSSTPEKLNRLLTSDLSCLVYLKAALIRLSSEYPDDKYGLPLTERLILSALENGCLSPVELFAAYQKLEEAEFMGDMTFWLRLDQLAFNKIPLLNYKVNQSIKYPIAPEQMVSINPKGEQYLAVGGNWFKDNLLEKYVGGCLIKS